MNDILTQPKNLASLNWQFAYPFSKIALKIPIYPPVAELPTLLHNDERIRAWVKRWRNLWTEKRQKQAQKKIPENLFETGTEAQECMLLRMNIKPGTRIVIPANTAFSCVQYASKIGLFAVPSAFLFRTIPIDAHSTYSDEVAVVESESLEPDVSVFLYLGRDILTIWKLWALEALQDHIELGLALGYPRCCAKAYIKQSKKELGSKVCRRPILTNQYTHFFGYQIISHDPCRIDCPASLKIAQEYLHALQKISPASAKKLVQVLSAPVFELLDKKGFIILLDAEETGQNEIRFTTSKMLIMYNDARSLANHLIKLGVRLNLKYQYDSLIITNRKNHFDISDEAKLILHK